MAIERAFLRLPHARGGVSERVVAQPGQVRSSPRPWGCFYIAARRAEIIQVFPTPVGVFPTRRFVGHEKLCLPHARGGVSCAQGRGQGRIGSSPRPWGCFHLPPLCSRATSVFPTPVGVFPLIFKSASWSNRSSPRPWGCFYLLRGKSCWMAVFPTPVGVFLGGFYVKLERPRLPHARGGVSNKPTPAKT